MRCRLGRACPADEVGAGRLSLHDTYLFVCYAAAHFMFGKGGRDLSQSVSVHSVVSGLLIAQLFRA